MKIFLKYILPIFTCFLSLVAVIIGSVAVAKAYKEPEVYNVYQIGLHELYSHKATQMYVDGPWPSDYIKYEVDDRELCEEVYGEICETLRYSLYTPAKKPKFNPKAFGSGWHYTVLFDVNGKKYGVSSIVTGTLEVSVDGEYSYYKTDCVERIKKIIDDLVEYLSPSDTESPDATE